MPKAHRVTVLQINADDPARARITELLQRDPLVEIVGATADPVEGVDLIRRLEPMLVMLELALAKSSEINIARITRSVAPRSHVLVLSDRVEKKSLSLLLNWRVHGCLLKSADADQLQSAVHQVAAGHPFFSPELAGDVLDVVWAQRSLIDDLPSSGPTLTNRQTEVLKCVRDGLRNRDIAAALGVRHRTVEAHIEQIFVRLRATSRTEAVLIASSQGILPPGDAVFIGPRRRRKSIRA